MSNAAIIEALLDRALTDAAVRDPDLDHQHLNAARALRELDRVRVVAVTTGGRTINLVTRHTPLQAKILAAAGVDTHDWDRAHMT